jgi:hypothetical protein
MPCSTALICALAVPKMCSNVGQKGQVSGPLDSHGQTPLVLSTGSRPTARLDLALIGDKAAQKFWLLVVYNINLSCAKGAHLATLGEPPFPTTLGSLSPTTR